MRGRGLPGWRRLPPDLPTCRGVPPRWAGGGTSQRVTTAPLLTALHAETRGPVRQGVGGRGHGDGGRCPG